MTNLHALVLRIKKGVWPIFEIAEGIHIAIVPTNVAYRVWKDLRRPIVTVRVTLK